MIDDKNHLVVVDFTETTQHKFKWEIRKYPERGNG
jgi:hypothetical protein